MDAKEKDEETTSSNTNNGELETEIEEEEEKEQVWGTLEELLLVCAINRHGTNCWDFIANELQKRFILDNNNNQDLIEEPFNQRNCRLKYVHLKRRFNGNGNGVCDMVEELRKLRVQELKRQVHRHDASIVSLEMKVKRLEEEREKSKISDLRNEPEKITTSTGKKPDEPVEKVIPCDSTENRSCNESNSTNNKEREPKLNSKGEPDPVRPDNNKNKSEDLVGEGKVSGLGELGESLSESRKQQSSDVQSSVSLTKKKRRRVRGGDINNSGDELEVEEISPANKRINAKSQPLVRFFDALRSHKHGSVFNRRLPSQETEKYRNVIRQHLDLDTVQSRLDKGIYCDCHPKFYRDLLLIFTNAMLFYRKSSAEHIAARELRKLVIDEINQKMQKPKIQLMKPDVEPQHLEPVVKKPRSSTTQVQCKRRSSSSMQALSDSMKKGDANNIRDTNSQSNVKVEDGHDEKVQHDLQKKVNGSSGSNNNNGSLSSKEKESIKGGVVGSLKNLLTRERSSFGNGGLRLSNNNGKKIISKDSNKRDKIESINKEESSEGDGAEVREKKKVQNSDQKQEKGTPTLLKKQGVANFLKRMNQNSPSSQEKTKNDDLEGEEEEEEVKKNNKEKTLSTSNGNIKKASGNTRKNTKEIEASITRRSSSRKGDKEDASSRRGLGRPPKRKAAIMSGNSTPDSVKGGRSGGRDSSEKVAKKKPRR